MNTPIVCETDTTPTVYECGGCAHGEHDKNCRWVSNTSTPKTRIWHKTDGRSIIQDDMSLQTLWITELGYRVWLGIDRDEETT